MIQVEDYMKLNELLEFRKDLYFDGAVQIDWFYDQEKSKRVAENFVFHGKEYFGVENNGSNKLIDTVSLAKELLLKAGNSSCNPLSLAIADYGTGKSHLAVTLSHLFSGSEYCLTTYQKILENISTIDKETELIIRETSKKRNLVLTINGMRDFNLHSELLKTAQKSLQLYGISDDRLRKINKSIEIAEIFLARNAKSSLQMFEAKATELGWNERGTRLISRIKDNLLTDNEAFEIINLVYEDINGHKIRWDEDISASAILEQLIGEYCGINGEFDSVIILFDEFGRYLEYASGTDSVRSGESALQQIFECSQNAEGQLNIICFIQSDIKSYLQRVDNTRNISRYIGRYDVSDKYYISSNLETVFANLIQRKDTTLFKQYVQNSLNSRECYWKSIFTDLNNWTSLMGVWADYSLFRKVIVEGIYPLHPISTFMLTQLSDYLQNRSSLTMISNYIQESGEIDVQDGCFSILPERLMIGDLYTEMLAAEQEGRQSSQHCLQYTNILGKFSDKLSEKSLTVLRSNLVLRVLRLKTNSLSEVKKALLYCCDLSENELDEELDVLTNEYGILGYDDRAHCFDFMEESNGAHDYKILKKRLLFNTSFESSFLTNIEILEKGEFLTHINTQFGMDKHISTKEWEFKQELYMIEELSLDLLNQSILDWKNAVQPEIPKGKIIWLYVHKDTDPVCIDNACSLCSKIDRTPIVLMLLNDVNNHLYNDLIEYRALQGIDEEAKSRFERHYRDDVEQNLTRIATDFKNLKKERSYLTAEGISKFDKRLAIAMSTVFDSLYPQIISFPFDGFVSAKYNISRNQAKTYVSIVRALLSGEVNDSIIHNWPTDIRNRFSALFDMESKYSWKCYSDQAHIVPPLESKARNIYDLVTNQLENNDVVSCNELLALLTMPPYGLNYYAVVIFICVVISNLHYCTRILFKDNVYSPQSWRDLLLVKDNKTNPDVFANSFIKRIDADQVSEKFHQLFNQIEGNKNADRVSLLSEQLNQMLRENDLPKELEDRYVLIQKILNDGANAKIDFINLFNSIVSEQNMIRPTDLYPAVKIIGQLMVADFQGIFEKYNYKYTEIYSSKVTDSIEEMEEYINDHFDVFLSSLRCYKVEGMNTYRNHTSKLYQMFMNIGCEKYAIRIKEQAEHELNNIELIKSRAAFVEDYNNFYQKCKITKHTSYSQLVQWKQELSGLIKRFNAFYKTLKNQKKIKSGLEEKRDLLKNEIDSVKEEIGSIFDDSYELKNISDIDNLIYRANNSIKRGLEDQDTQSLEELLEDLDILKVDILKLENATNDRKYFDLYSKELYESYLNKDSDLLTEDLIVRFIDFYKEQMNSKENEWITKNLTLGVETDSDIFAWKDTIKNVPRYLSEETLKKINYLDEKADNILRKRKIETAVHYFFELNEEEKNEFFNIINPDF